MAERIERFRNEEYRESITGISQLMEKVDITEPSTNVLSQDITTNELLKLQAENQASTLTEILEFMKSMVTLTPDQPDTLQLMTENAGDKVTVAVQKEHLDKIAKKNYLLTRMIQQRHSQKDARATGSYADKSRDPICTIPPIIATGATGTINDSALKLLTTFNGDTSHEAEALKAFLRAIFDVAITNTLNETCVKAILKRKLGGTARRLIDSYEQELEQEGNSPSLREMILKLEDRYMADWQPEIANAKLSMCQKGPNQTLQKLEGEISELAILAARAEKVENRPAWIKQRQTAVFKQAINDKDRQNIYRENQSRIISGLPEMTMSQMCNHLIKSYSEANAFAAANSLKKTTNPVAGLPSEADSFNTVQEKLTKKEYFKKKKETAKIKKTEEKATQQKLKDEVFAMYQQGKFQPNSNNQGGGFRGGRNNRGNQRRGGFNSGNQNRNGNFGNKTQGEGFNGDKNNLKPRKFVTPEMVNVPPNACLKCASPTHRFQEVDKCVYGKSNLMTRACPNCNEGGHHFKACIKNQKPTIGTQASQPQEPLDPNFSRWPKVETNKSMPQANSPWNQTKNGEWLPSLFPY